MSETGSEILSAPHVIEYTYTRSLGPVLRRFFTGLRERRILGIRRPDGSVLVPPRAYDPDTGESLSEMVPVSSEGVVKSFAWVRQPRPKQPLSRPFAWALVLLDGADTPMLHAVDAGSPERMRTGMRVRARFRSETRGAITDIECFEPVEGT